MKCNTRAILIAGASLWALSALSYVALPRFPGLLLNLGPTLLILLCPLSMLMMRKGIVSHHVASVMADTPVTQGDKHDGPQSTNVP
ncbi:hypothetical protein ACUXQ2_005737 [Cupriavidus metallidurans]